MPLPPTPLSPPWWRDRLIAKLMSREAEMQRLQDYYDGKHPLAFASEKFREAFGGRFRTFANNFCPLVIEAVAERMQVTGFRAGAKQDAPADADAWRIWQTNSLDAESELAHTQSLIKGASYALISPFANEWPEEDVPLITVEDAQHVTIDTAPGNRRKRRAALKRWIDDEGHLVATLYLPDEIYKFRSAKPYDPAIGTVEWKDYKPPGDTARPLTNRLGVVPVVLLPNRPSLDGGFDSELTPMLPLQDSLNKEFLDMLVASEFAAYRQRYILNLDLETDSETGQPRVPFSKTGVDRMMIFPTPDPGMPETKVGEFNVSDLGQYIKVFETIIQQIASKTRTPAHYLLGQAGTFPSGESLRATEAGLTLKARQKMRHLGEGWEDVIRVAYLALGDQERAGVPDSETIWADPELKTEAEHVDALVKLKSLGIPEEQLWEDAGYSPTQIARFRRIAGRAALVALPPPAVPVVADVLNEAPDGTVAA